MACFFMAGTYFAYFPEQETTTQTSTEKYVFTTLFLMVGFCFFGVCIYARRLAAEAAREVEADFFQRMLEAGAKLRSQPSKRVDLVEDGEEVFYLKASSNLNYLEKLKCSC
jgi:hypothetical protein